MKKIFMVLLIICIPSVALALDMDPFEGPRPLAVLIETNPWLMVIGSDTPTVVIYDDGQLIYIKKEKDKSFSYFYKQLAREELEAVKKKMVSFGDLSKIGKYYELTDVTDQPEIKIYLNLDGNELTTTVYGLIELDEDGKLPESLKSLYEYLTTLDFKDAVPWKPQYIEVMIWEYEYAPDESIHWPKEWPGLESPQAMKRGDSYSIFLPGAELPRLLDFLRTGSQGAPWRWMGRNGPWISDSLFRASRFGLKHSERRNRRNSFGSGNGLASSGAAPFS
jgi:hypothetical protein